MELITPCRFDLMAKYLYVKYKDVPFFKELYHQHILTFNNCFEAADPTVPNSIVTKTKIGDFFKEFDNLIENMKSNGFDTTFPIPVGSNGVIWNGSHRLITSLFLNKSPTIKYLNSPADVNYNYKFFINRSPNPLDRLYADRMALEYINVNKNIRCMIIYPNVFKMIDYRQLSSIISKYGYIYYHKQINLNMNGINNLIKELYRGERWIGGMFPRGWIDKSQLCVDSYPIHFFLIEMKNPEKSIELKEECRQIFKKGKHSLHMSDETYDTFRIGSSLLNDNSIHFLNNGTNDISNETKVLLINYFNKIKNNEDYCLTSSLVLEMYRVRKAKDIDYIHLNNHELNLRETGIHAGEWLKYYPYKKEDIIHDPRYHFYFNGVKFTSLDIIKKMKKNRNEHKDIQDLKLIETTKFVSHVSFN